MDMARLLLTKDEVSTALSDEFDSPPRLLPPSSVSPALIFRLEEVAEWIQARLSGKFLPTPEEIVAVSKGRHGVRPVAIWDLPSQVAYRVLASRLASALPVVSRGKTAWRAFQRSPLEHEGRYVVASDIAACYQHIDHGLLEQELLIKTGDHLAVEAVSSLLFETSGRNFGLPQQSHASDVLAEAVLDRLERALVRRGLLVARYNDDFRFTCSSWSAVVRSIEVLSEEARLMGLTVNDMKTVTWRRSKYEERLDEADQLRQEIADEAELDLTLFEDGPYDEPVIAEAPDPDEVNILAARRVLERWVRVAGRGAVGARRKAEHRAVVEILPVALATLGAKRETSAEVLAYCMRILRFERTMTPAVSRYLEDRDDGAAVLAAFDRLIRSRSYLSGWQTWWLQQPVARQPEFASGIGARGRLRWAMEALVSAEHTPVLRAHAALTLARHKQIQVEDLLTIYDRSSAAVRPLLVAAIGLLEPSNSIRRSITDESDLHKWVYEWATLYA
jgi:RNA-directed DNA polymerase